MKKSVLTSILFLLFIFSYSQSKKNITSGNSVSDLEIVLPEGLGLEKPNYILNSSSNQAIFYSSSQDRKLFVWNLDKSELERIIKLEYSIRSIDYHHEKNLLYISSTNVVCIINTNTGVIIKEHQGTNSIAHGLTAFNNDSYIFNRNDSIIIKSLLDDKPEIVLVDKQTSNGLSNCSFVKGSDYIIHNWISNKEHKSGLTIYKDNKFVSELENNLFIVNYIIKEDKLIIEIFSKEYLVYDISNMKLIHKISFKDKDVIDKRNGKIIFFDDNYVKVLDVLRNKIIDKFETNFENIRDYSVSDNQEQLAVFGENENNKSNIGIYNFKSKKFNWIFDNDADNDTDYVVDVIYGNRGRNIFRVYKSKIIINDIPSSRLTRIINNKNDYHYSTYPFKPKLIDNKYILIVNTNSTDFSEEEIQYIDISNGEVIWTTRLPGDIDNIEVDITNRAIKYSSTYLMGELSGGENGTIKQLISLDKGTIIIEEESTSGRLDIFSTSIEKAIVVKDSMGDNLNSSYEYDKYILIKEIDFASNKEEVFVKQVSTQPINYYYFKNKLVAQFNDEILTFDVNNLSKEESVYKVETSGSSVILDLNENKSTLIINYPYKKDSISFVSLKTMKPIIDKKLFLVEYNKKHEYALVKDSIENIIKVDLLSNIESPTSVNLRGSNSSKISHGKFFSYSNKTNDSIYIYDISKNKLIRTFKCRSKYYLLSKDGNLYITASKYLHSTITGKEYSTLQTYIFAPEKMHSLTFTKNGKSLIYQDDGDNISELNLDDKSITIYNIFSSEFKNGEKELDVINSNNFLTFDSHNSWNGCSSEINYITDLKTQSSQNITGQEDKLLEGKFSIPFIPSDNGNNLIMFTDKQVRIFDLNTAENSINIEYRDYHYIAKNNRIIISRGDRISLFNINTGKVIWEVKVDNSYSKWIGLQNNRVIIIDGVTIIALDINNGNEIDQIKLRKEINFNFLSYPIINDTEILIDYSSLLEKADFHSYIFDKDKLKYVKYTEDILVSKFKTTISEHDSYNLTDDILVKYNFQSNLFSIIDINLDVLVYSDTIELLDFKNVITNTKDKTVFFSGLDGNCFLIDYQSQKMVRFKIKGDYFSISGNKLFVRNYNKIDSYILGSDSLSYSIMPLKEEKYVISIPQGYYLTTKSASKLLKFKFRNKYYSFDQFDLVFNRPDLVLEKMESSNKGMIKAYNDAYIKRIKRQSFKSTSVIDEIPELEILNQHKINSTVTSNIVDIELKGESKNVNLNKLIIKVNDNISEEVKLNSNSFTDSFSIELNKGNNLIESYVIDMFGVKSVSKKISVNYKPEGNDVSKVYFFGIGVSDYNNNDYDLKYASKDIRDLTTTLKNRYPNLIIDTLIDNRVTIENILQLKDKLSKTNIDDKVILSFCGHGVVDDDNNWYYATHDLDFSKPADRGLSFEVLQSLTENIGSRQKLITIDACHSGEIDIEDVEISNTTSSNTGKVKGYKRGSVALKSKTKTKSTFTLMKQLFSDLENSDGTIVISASGGMEYAFESKEYKNGVFTYSLIDKLEKSVWNTLKISELQKDVINNVYNLTNGKQKPNVRIGSLDYDWVLW